MARKRHHASKRARHAEHMGMERYERGPVRHHHDDMGHRPAGHPRDMMISDGYYAGPHARFRQEMQDGGMIHEDHNAIANMPQNVMMKMYPKEGYYLPENLDDTIRGIDRQIMIDDKKRMKSYDPDNKY